MKESGKERVERKNNPKKKELKKRRKKELKKEKKEELKEEQLERKKELKKLKMASRSPSSSINRETGIRDVASDAQYLSSNCVVYLYYSDLGSVIEEHFSKALNSQQQQSNNFSDNKSKGTFFKRLLFKGEKLKKENEREREKMEEREKMKEREKTGEKE